MDRIVYNTVIVTVRNVTQSPEVVAVVQDIAELNANQTAHMERGDRTVHPNVPANLASAVIT